MPLTKFTSRVVLELTQACNTAFGVQSGRIRNAQMMASSMWDKFHAPFLGRLNRKRTGRYMGGWSARHNNHKQWLQVDVGRNMKLSMISTQGRLRAKQWVTRYTVSYSIDGVHFVPYKTQDRLKVCCRALDFYLGRILLGLFRRFLFRYKNNRTYRISIPKRTDFVLL